MINAVGNRMTREIARQQSLAEQLERTQIQISGGKKLLRMSDDPVAARRIATIGTTQASMAAWSANVNSASALDSATFCCVRLQWHIRCLPRSKHPPDVLFLVRTSPAQSLSV